MNRPNDQANESRVQTKPRSGDVREGRGSRRLVSVSWCFRRVSEPGLKYRPLWAKLKVELYQNLASYEVPSYHLTTAT